MSKGYTIEYFIREIKKLENKHIEMMGLAHAISPRKGICSVKVRQLSKYLGYYAEAVAKGRGTYYKLGKTPKARLINALRFRQRNGFHNYNPELTERLGGK